MGEAGSVEANRAALAQARADADAALSQVRLEQFSAVQNGAEQLSGRSGPL